MRYELTLYDTEAREDRAIEYTQARRRAAVWARMKRIKLGGSHHHLLWRVREYSTGPKRPEKRLDPHLQRQLTDLHQQVREAKSLTGAQAEALTRFRDGEHSGARGKTLARLVNAELIEGSTRAGYEITAKGREWLELRLLP